MEEKLVDLLNSLVSYLPKLDRGLDRMLDNFQQGEKEEGLELLSQFTEGLLWVHEALNAIENTQEVNPGVFKLDNSSVLYNELNKALENEDFVLISDILRYEIKEELQVYYGTCVDLLKSFNK